MTKLDTINQALKENPEVVMTDKPFQKLNIPVKGFEMGGPVRGHDIIYFVAPREGLYTVNELQAFMLDLVPGLEPSSQRDFKQEGFFGALIYGTIHYQEEIGEETIDAKLTLTDQEAINLAELGEGQSTIHNIVTRDYMRHITILPFPNEDLANRAFKRISEGKGAAAIFLWDLKSYNSKIYRLLNLLYKGFKKLTQ